MAEQDYGLPPGVLDGTWAALDGAERAADDDDSDEAADLDEAFRRVFGSRDGQIVLRELVARCWLHAGYDATLGLEYATAMGLQRDGQKQLVQEIWARITRATNRKDGGG